MDDRKDNYLAGIFLVIAFFYLMGITFLQRVVTHLFIAKGLTSAANHKGDLRRLY
ncbi:hypothetical protein GCM10007905_05270 [Mixta theicola]|nr:hypothetical protein GCM10007905_05270 [Mixta theicola]